MVKMAVMGFGVVGSGTVELFYKNKASIEKRAGKEMDIKYILDIRDFPDSPYKDKFVKSVDTIVNDKEISVVAEVMGGVHPAYEFVSACLKSGKSVVTSNKALVAEKGAELLKFAKEAGCNFFFEASVGGAIPIIRPLHQCLAANEITEIAGILNGTTNFILNKMINDSMSFEDALSLAQKLGYAEKDPTADVEGHDACRKICILASLAFGKHIYPSQVHTNGISHITLEDVSYARSWGGDVKLIASVKKLDDGRILPMVRPAFVPADNMLSSVDGVFNAVMVLGDGIDRVMFYGRGAGKLPTASAVVADMIDAVKASSTSVSQVWEDNAEASFIAPYKEDEVSMYIRVKGEKSKINEIFGDVQFISRDGEPSDEAAFIAPKMAENKLDEKLSKLSEAAEVLGKIRVLEME